MSNVYITSDPHFSHANILKFEKNDGTKMREFASVEEMDEFIIACFNDRVRPSDKCYILGDFAMHKRFIPKLGRLNGHLRGVLGNHDEADLRLYMPFFEKIFSSRRLDNLLLTHIPVHPLSLKPGQINVHGHVHNNVPQGHFGLSHYNVSVEMTDYYPLTIEEIKQRHAKMRDDYMAHSRAIVAAQM